MPSSLSKGVDIGSCLPTLVGFESRCKFCVYTGLSLSFPLGESPTSHDSIRRQRLGCEWVRLCQVLRSVLICCAPKYQSVFHKQFKSFQRFHLVKEGGVAKGEVRKGQCSEPPSQCCVGLSRPGVTSVTHMCPTWWAMCAAAGLWSLRDPPCLEECRSADLAIWVGAGSLLQARGQESQGLSCGGTFQPHGPVLPLLSPTTRIV